MSFLDFSKPANKSFYITTPCLEFINGNRSVDDIQHVYNIEEAMRRNEPIEPVMVDKNTGLIINGQHRYTAACNIWKRGEYYELLIVVQHYENPLLSAILCNSKSKRWNTDNYVDAYIIDGRESYKLLKDFVNSHSLFSAAAFGTINYIGAAQMLTGLPCRGIIPKGNLFISEEQIVKGEETYNQIKQMIEATGCKALISRHHILAWLETREYILSKMSLDKFCVLMKKHFIAPASSSKKMWIAEYLRVASKL